MSFRVIYPSQMLSVQIVITFKKILCYIVMFYGRTGEYHWEGHYLRFEWVGVGPERYWERQRKVREKSHLVYIKTLNTLYVSYLLNYLTGQT